jgi:succinate dehydrogenase / fumarate reductase membrane anchor subunit
MNAAGLSGLRAWIVQRLSAIYIVIFMAVFILPFAWHPSLNYAHWYSWVADPVNNSAVALFVVALLMHAWVGVRDVILDYVKPYTARALVLSLLLVGLLLLALWALRILFLVGYP